MRPVHHIDTAIDSHCRYIIIYKKKTYKEKKNNNKICPVTISENKISWCHFAPRNVDFSDHAWYGLLLILSTILVARLCTRSTSFSSARLNGPQIRLPYSRCGLTRVLNSRGMVCSSIFANALRTSDRIWAAFDTADDACFLNFNSGSMKNPQVSLCRSGRKNCTLHCVWLWVLWVPWTDMHRDTLLVEWELPFLRTSGEAVNVPL